MEKINFICFDCIKLYPIWPEKCHMYLHSVKTKIKDNNLASAPSLKLYQTHYPNWTKFCLFELQFGTVIACCNTLYQKYSPGIFMFIWLSFLKLPFGEKMDLFTAEALYKTEYLNEKRFQPYSFYKEMKGLFYFEVLQVSFW